VNPEPRTACPFYMCKLAEKILAVPDFSVPTLRKVI
jgi:hypothetical protein